MSITNEQKEKFIELRAKGLSFDKCSTELGISKQTLIKWQREFKEEIANQEFFNHQSLLEQYQLLRHQKFENLAKTLSKVWQEIEQRDLSEVTLKDLLMMKTLLDRELKDEIQQIQYFTGQQASPVVEAMFSTKPITLDLDKI